LGAVHNFILQSITHSGIISTIFLLFFTFQIVKHSYNLMKKNFCFSLAVTISVLFCAAVDNFFIGAYGPLMYVYYITAGISANEFRLQPYVQNLNAAKSSNDRRIIRYT